MNECTPLDDGIFGVVKIGPKQYKVSPDDLIFVDKIAQHQAGAYTRPLLSST